MREHLKGEVHLVSGGAGVGHAELGAPMAFGEEPGEDIAQRKIFCLLKNPTPPMQTVR